MKESLSSCSSYFRRSEIPPLALILCMAFLGARNCDNSDNCAYGGTLSTQTLVLALWEPRTASRRQACVHRCATCSAPEVEAASPARQLFSGTGCGASGDPPVGPTAADARVSPPSLRGGTNPAQTFLLTGWGWVFKISKFNSFICITYNHVTFGKAFHCSCR